MAGAGLPTYCLVRHPLISALLITTPPRLKSYLKEQKMAGGRGEKPPRRGGHP